jgi:hypothetical protein
MYWRQGNYNVFYERSVPTTHMFHTATGNSCLLFLMEAGRLFSKRNTARTYRSSTEVESKNQTKSTSPSSSSSSYYSPPSCVSGAKGSFLFSKILKLIFLILPDLPTYLE